jgi:hypothetical protein
MAKRFSISDPLCAPGELSFLKSCDGFDGRHAFACRKSTIQENMALGSFSTGRKASPL